MAESFEGEIIHASAISCDKKGLVINGPSGSGKSTLALLCAQSGFNMLADDVVLFSDGQISAIYNYAKIDPRTSPLDVSGIDTFQVEHSFTAKKIFHINHFNENFYNPVVASAIIFPIFAHMNHFERINSKIALKILAPNCLRELMGGSSVNFKQLSQLVQSIPSYRVAVSTNNEKNLDSINQILSELS
jgi:ABC-type cobalamin/Fe3+-siderophores transport system ATPase subunit